MQQNQLDMINNSPIFGGIQADTVRNILKHSKIIEKDKDQYFFRENELAESMFILLDGQVEIQKSWQGKSYQIQQLLAGNCFGEMAIIEHCARSASVIALNHCQAIELNIECFNEIYLQNIEEYSMLQLNMGREVSRRLREANDLLFKNEIENDLKDNIYLSSV